MGNQTMLLEIKKGINIPLKGIPHNLLPCRKKPSQISLNLDSFSDVRFSLLIEEGSEVKIGQALAENKKYKDQFFVSPAAGRVCQIRRGEKRVLRDIIIDVAQEENSENHYGLASSSSREEILNYFLKTGLFAHISSRPFQKVPDPRKIPRDIFVKAIETRSFSPPFEMQLEGNRDFFQIGLSLLKKLTSGEVFLVYSSTTTETTFLEAQDVKRVAVSGPHPAGNPSVHIHHLAPIRHVEDIVWTLNALDVIVIGRMVKLGQYYVDRFIGCGGEGLDESQRGFLKTRMGVPISSLVSPVHNCRLISGDPLDGSEVSQSDFLKLPDLCFVSLPEQASREAFHFLRPGLNKYSAHRGYFSHLKKPTQAFSFSTNQHGEERAFIDGSIYDRVMPMKIPTMPLIRALLAEDFELAEELGFLEIVPEDFSLPAFICPSKIEMPDIVRKSIKIFSKELE